MERPDWVSEPAWADALAELCAVSAGWEPAARGALNDRFAVRVASGAPLAAALILAITDLLGAPRHE